MDLVVELRHLYKKTEPSGFDWTTAHKLAGETETVLPFDFSKVVPFDEALSAGKVKDGIVPFSEQWLGMFNKASKHPYLVSRGVSQKDAVDLDIRYDPARNRICFPLRTFDGTLAGLHGRTLNPGEEPRYLAYDYQKKFNPSVWLGERQVSLDWPLVVTEGPFDYARVFSVYRNVLCSLSANVSVGKLRRIRSATRILTMFDGDEGGSLGRQKLEKFFKVGRVSHYVPETDVGDMDALSVLGVLKSHYIIADETEEKAPWL